MHELALCEAVLAVAFDAAGDREIARVKVRVGELQRVLPESWEMCWKMASLDSTAAQSVSELAVAPARVRCRSCGAEDAPRPPLDCAHCGGASVEVIAGDAIVVEEIELAGGELIVNPSLAGVAEES